MTQELSDLLVVRRSREYFQRTGPHLTERRPSDEEAAVRRVTDDTRKRLPTRASSGGATGCDVARHRPPDSVRGKRCDHARNAGTENHPGSRGGATRRDFVRAGGRSMSASGGTRSCGGGNRMGDTESQRRIHFGITTVVQGADFLAESGSKRNWAHSRTATCLASAQRQRRSAAHSGSVGKCRGKGTDHRNADDFAAERGGDVVAWAVD